MKLRDFKQIIDDFYDDDGGDVEILVQTVSYSPEGEMRITHVQPDVDWDIDGTENLLVIS